MKSGSTKDWILSGGGSKNRREVGGSEARRPTAPIATDVVVWAGAVAINWCRDFKRTPVRERPVGLG
jgi:hypothetical protein